MMLEATTGKPETRWSNLWRFTKHYISHVTSTYLNFAAPIALILAFNMAVDAQDTERFGLAWGHYASLNDAREREEKFPAYAPGSAPQRKRMAAASATEFVAAAV